MRPLNKRDTDVLIDGSVETTEITVQTSRDIVDMLIARIYSDGEATAVRELIANALDAHVEAGIQDTPIDVFLPGSLNPTFTVRDYGNSMTHEFVMKLYSQLGFSSKSDSNDYTGMMGIGSKSPISFSDTFSLKCYDGQTARNYIIHMNQDGRLVITHTIAAANDQPKGTEVTIPVNQASTIKILAGFRKQQMAWFDKPVNFYGADKLKVALNEYERVLELTTGLYLGVPSTTAAGASHVYFVRQGAAVYPLDLNQVNLSSGNRELLKHYFKTNRHMIIDAPIGTLSVTASREALRYDEDTRENLVNLIREKIKCLYTEFHDAVGKAYTVNEAVDRLTQKITPEDAHHIPAYMDAVKFFPIVHDLLNENWHEYCKGSDILSPALHREIGSLPDLSGELDPHGNAKTIPIKYYKADIHLLRQWIPVSGNTVSVTTYPSTGTATTVVTTSATSNVTTNAYGIQGYHGPNRVTLNWEKRSKYDEKSRKEVRDRVTISYPNIIIAAYPGQQAMYDKAEKLVQTLLANETADDRIKQLTVHVAVVQKKYMKAFEYMLECTGLKCFFFTPDDLKEQTVETVRQVKEKRRTLKASNKGYLWTQGRFNRQYTEVDASKPCHYVMRRRGTQTAQFEYPNNHTILGYPMKNYFSLDQMREAWRVCKRGDELKPEDQTLVLIDPDDETEFTKACPLAINVFERAAKLLNAVKGQIPQRFLSDFVKAATKDANGQTIRLSAMNARDKEKLIRMINLDPELRLIYQLRKNTDKLQGTAVNGSQCPWNENEITHYLRKLCNQNTNKTIQYASPKLPEFEVLKHYIEKANKRYHTVFYNLYYNTCYGRKKGYEHYHNCTVVLDAMIKSLEQRPIKQRFRIPAPLNTVFNMDPISNLQEYNDDGEPLDPRATLW